MKRIYCIPNIDHLTDFMYFSKAYDAGFEYNEFYRPEVLEDDKKIQELIDRYTSLDRDRSEDTLHGVFLDMCVNSHDPLIFQATDFRIHQSMEIASRLGIKAVIFHTNHIPTFRLKSYREEWLSRNIAYWKKLLAEYPSLSIYLENMFDEEPEMLFRLSEAMQTEPRFGVCLDLAHAFLSSTPLKDWCDALLPRAVHLHLNDNDGVEDSHSAVGSKSIPWQLYHTAIDSIPEGKRPTVLIEVKSYETLMQSVEYMKGHHLYPF